MLDYIILTDSSCDLPLKIIEKLNISVVPLSVCIGDVKYKNYPNESEITNSKFYDLLRKKNVSKTSGVNINDFIDKMESFLKEGKDILYLGFSSTLSCTYNNALNAVHDLLEKYPERKICTVDTLCGSLGQGLIVYLTALEKKKGMLLEEAKTFVEKTKMSVSHWFVLDDLNHAKRGGRVSAATAMIGNMLNIKPILHVDESGKIVSDGKVRGRKAAIDFIAEKFGQTAIQPDKSTVCISHGDCEGDAKNLAGLLKKNFKVKDIIINYMGPVIGSHGGPDALALFFLGNKR